jgi:hypothetical protein
MMARIRRSFSEAMLSFVLRALMAGVAGYILIGGRHADAAKAESRTTTESAAEAAGARTTPTQPKLSVEPK